MNGIIRRIYRKKDIKEIENKLSMLGKKNKFSVASFLNIRLFSTVFLAILLLYFTKLTYLLVPIIIVIYYIAFSYMFITKPLNERKSKLEYEALYFFEVLAVTLESGKNLENAIELTCKNIDSNLSDEFAQALVEVRFGKSLMEALDSLKQRIPSETVQNIIMSMMQTSTFGNNIVAVMNNQVEYLRDKQMLEIKEKINKIPNKISIVSVLFIVPLILLMILGPFIVEFFG